MYAAPGPHSTGILERTPLLIKENANAEEGRFPWQIGDTSTFLEGISEQHNNSGKQLSSNLDLLEDYVLQVLLGYHKTATQCYHSAMRYWDKHSEHPKWMYSRYDDDDGNDENARILKESADLVSKNESHATWSLGLVFVVGCLAGLVMMSGWLVLSRRLFRRRQHAQITDPELKHASFERGNTDDTFQSEDDEMMLT